MSRIYLGHDPWHGDDGTDVMVTLWDDDVIEVALREGHDRRWVTWNPPVQLTEETQQ